MLFASTRRLQEGAADDLAVGGSDLDVSIRFIVVEEEFPAICVVLHSDGGAAVHRLVDAVLLHADGFLESLVGVDFAVAPSSVPGALCACGKIVTA